MGHIAHTSDKDLNYFLFGLFFFCLTSRLIPQTNICSDTYINNEKDIRKIYLSYKLKANKCLSWKNYFQLGERAYVASKLKEALWSANTGLQILSNKKGIALMSLKLLKGNILAEMNRLEEAIIVLKEIVFFNNSTLTKEMNEKQEKAHLQLIQVYFNKTNSKKNQDIIYLVTLFQNRYPKSKYLKLLQNWNFTKVE